MTFKGSNHIVHIFIEIIVIIFVKNYRHRQIGRQRPGLFYHFTNTDWIFYSISVYKYEIRYFYNFITWDPVAIETGTNQKSLTFPGY